MFKKLSRKLASFFRKRKMANIKHKSLLQTDVSIFSNNCTAGIMYSDFNFEFLSPTINLSFGEDEDFYFFLANLRLYCENGKLIFYDFEKKRMGFVGTPIANLVCDGLPVIRIHFLHYHSFEDAKNAWERRCKRINYNKIFVIIEAQSKYEQKMIPKYAKLPYPKIIFTSQPFDYSCCKLMKFYKKFGTGEQCPILKYVSIFGKRGYDEYDFVSDIFLRNYEQRK